MTKKQCIEEAMELLESAIDKIEGSLDGNPVYRKLTDIIYELDGLLEEE